MDEPTSGLDPLMQREFFDILRERNRAGTTVFLSGHILPEVQHNCTRAAILRSGRVVACGSVEELSRTGAKRISLRGRAPLDALEGVRDLRVTAEEASFLYSGEMTLSPASARKDAPPGFPRRGILQKRITAGGCYLAGAPAAPRRRWR